MTFNSTVATFIIALVVVVGAFAYFIVRGGADPVVTPIMSLALGTVLSYFFTTHIANGAAAHALNDLVQQNQALAEIIAGSATPAASPKAAPPQGG